MADAALLAAVRDALGKARDAPEVAAMTAALGLEGRDPAMKVLGARRSERDGPDGGATDYVYADFPPAGLSLSFTVDAAAAAPAVLRDVWCFADGVDGNAACTTGALLPSLTARGVVQAHGEPQAKAGGGENGRISIEYHGYAGLAGLNATIEFVTHSWDDAESPVRTVVYWTGAPETRA